MPPLNGSALVSVIVPCFNQGRYLSEAVESVLAQTYPNWECIIIDDGSTDHTSRVAADFVRRDDRVRCLAQPRRRLPRTRNRGLDEAKGDLIQFLDADDVILPEKLELQVAAHVGRANPAIVYCHYRFGSGDAVYEPPKDRTPAVSRLDPVRPLHDLARRWETGLSIPIHCFLFDARLFREWGLRFDITLPTHEDWDCWIRMIERRPALVYLNDALSIYRLHDDSMCRDMPVMRRGFIRAIKKQQRRFRLDREMSRLLAEKLRLTREVYRDHAPLAGARRVPGALLRALKAAVRTVVPSRLRPSR